MKILWLSDIHLKGTYNGKYTENYQQKIDNEFVKKYFTDFKEALSNEEIDCVLITGDLAFKADTDSYELLKYKLQFLSNDNIPIFTIPGNHDISFVKLDHLYFKSDNNIFNNRNIILAQNSKKFIELFGNYSKIIRNYELTKFGENNTNYINNGLSGYFIFKGNNKEKNEKREENGFIFIFINSAWFSVGSSFKQWLLDNKNNYEKDELIELFEQSQEVGKLITGVNINISEKDLKKYNINKKDIEQIFPTEKVLEILNNEEYNNYVKIVAMHHPIDWLDWAETFNYQITGTKLYEIIQKSNLLLTGHIHPPRFYKGEILGNTPHMRAPLFLSYKGKDDTINSNPGFVIINIENFIAEFKYYYYNYNSNIDKQPENGFIQEKNSSWKLDILKRNKDSINIDDENIDDNAPIIDENKEIDEKKMLIYIKNNFVSNNWKYNKDKSKKANWVVYNKTEDEKTVLLFIYTKGIEYNNFMELKEKIKELDCNKIKQINFIKFDNDYYNLKIQKERLGNQFKRDIEKLKLKHNEITIGDGEKLYTESKVKIIEEINKNLKEIEKELFNHLEDEFKKAKKENNEKKKSEIKDIFNKLSSTEFINRFIILDDFIRRGKNN